MEVGIALFGAGLGLSVVAFFKLRDIREWRAVLMLFVFVLFGIACMIVGFSIIASLAIGGALGG